MKTASSWWEENADFFMDVMFQPGGAEEVVQDGEVLKFIRAIQADALEAAAKVCDQLERQYLAERDKCDDRDDDWLQFNDIMFGCHESERKIRALAAEGER